MGRKLNQKDHNASIYFRLRDEDNWLILDRLMALPEYEKNRAKLLNDALTIGLPILLTDKTSKEIMLADEPKYEEQPLQERTIQGYGNALDPRIDEVIRLLSEIVMNTTLDKFMLSGLFNAKIQELENRQQLASKLSKGLLNNTPDCLYGTEIEMLKDMNKDEEDE